MTKLAENLNALSAKVDMLTQAPAAKRPRKAKELTGDATVADNAKAAAKTAADIAKAMKAATKLERKTTADAKAKVTLETRKAKIDAKLALLRPPPVPVAVEGTPAPEHVLESVLDAA